MAPRKPDAPVYHCSKGHEWSGFAEQPAICQFCVNEFLAEHCGAVEGGPLPEPRPCKCRKPIEKVYRQHVFCGGDKIDWICANCGTQDQDVVPQRGQPLD